MKKILLAFIPVIIIAIVIIIFLSTCSNPLIYKPGREWHFIIKSSNRPNIDTIILKTYDESFLTTQTKIEYIYNKIKKSTGGYSQSIESTGVIDRQGNFISRLFITPEIWLHPPRSNFLRMTEMLPFPWIKFPIYLGQRIDWELTPKEGWEELKGKTVKGNINVKAKIFYDNLVINDSCWVVEGLGESEIGKFNCKYYFSERYGFVYFFYDFNQYQIELIPLKMKF
jgi:hypothetical protein